MTESKAPIAIFAYNRKDNLEGMLASLQACHGFAESPIILFVDGPKSEKDMAQVEAVRAYARALNWSNLEVVCREKNMGLKQSIYTGVSSVCERYGRVIVLEDDLLLSPVALDYFNEGLTKYENEPRIWSIVGYQYDVPELREHNTALVLPFTHPWGWATWQRAWKQFDMSPTVDPRNLRSRTFKDAFDVYGLRDFRNMLVLNADGLINSWYILWYYTLFSAGGLSLFPPGSLIQNIGQKSGGTHASGLNPYHLLVHPNPPTTQRCLFPDRLFVDYWAIDFIRDSRDARVQKMISCFGRIKRCLKKGALG
ncbi:MAG: hypothetical protein PHD48_06735 [Alphaproteobacteria bacterium]|nr:hypothetical protein [Alphaproteobacteria bacterium]